MIIFLTQTSRLLIANYFRQNVLAKIKLKKNICQPVVCLRWGERDTCLCRPPFWGLPWGVTRMNFPYFWWKTLKLKALYTFRSTGPWFRKSWIQKPYTIDISEVNTPAVS